MKDRWYLDIKGNVQLLSAQQIIDLLIKHEAKVIHRVSKNKQDWNAICNESYFEDAINELIKLLTVEATQYGKAHGQAQNQGELSGFHNLNKMKLGINEQLQQAQILQDINYKLQSLRQLSSEIVTKKKHVIDMSETEIKDEVHPDDRNEYVNAPTFWHQFKNLFGVFNLADAKVRNRYAVVIFILTIGVFGVNKYLQIKKQKEMVAEAAQVQSALVAKASGDYDRAVQLFSTVKNQNLLDVKTVIELAEAHIQTKRYEAALGLLKLPVVLTLNKNELANLYTKFGGIAQKNGQVDYARIFYSTALEHGQIYAAMLNLALILIDDKKWIEAEKLLSQAMLIEGHDKAPLLLALAEVELTLDRLEASPAHARIKKIHDLIEVSKSPLSPFYQHFIAVQAILAAAQLDQNRFNTLTYEWLQYEPKLGEVDVNKYEDHLDYRRTTWAHLHKLAIEIYNGAFDNKLKSAFYAAFVARIKGLKEAVPFALFAYNNVLVTPALRGFLGYLVLNSGNIDGAKQILRSGDISQSRLGTMATTLLCSNHPDSACYSQKNKSANQKRKTSSTKK